ncbi:hypothetical protein E1B28_012848 [Marasmius oreades]|uniref:Uncharacterized protein n=1 Tax=Marasmius oreades TaxID=181124 RepID=A0A9P7RTS3_9AGAR|nr:uncharacterized protein E1B28_012848 [Marasmius oreades]KAG7088903.1 hypothetical protein E1B28_012848 [Marasmius oreades]
MHVLGICVVTLGSGVVGSSIIGICVGLGIAGFGSGGGTTTSLVALISNAGKEDQAISYCSLLPLPIVGILRRLVGGEVEVDEVVRKVRESLEYLGNLDSETREVVKRSYEDAIQNTMWVSLGLAGCALLCSVFSKEKRLK